MDSLSGKYAGFSPVDIQLKFHKRKRQHVMEGWWSTIITVPIQKYPKAGATLVGGVHPNLLWFHSPENSGIETHPACPDEQIGFQ